MKKRVRFQLPDEQNPDSIELVEIHIPDPDEIRFVSRLPLAIDETDPDAILPVEDVTAHVKEPSSKKFVPDAIVRISTTPAMTLAYFTLTNRIGDSKVIPKATFLSHANRDDLVKATHILFKIMNHAIDTTGKPGSEEREVSLEAGKIFSYRETEEDFEKWWKRQSAEQNEEWLVTALLMTVRFLVSSTRVVNDERIVLPERFREGGACAPS